MNVYEVPEDVVQRLRQLLDAVAELDDASLADEAQELLIELEDDDGA